MCALPAVRIRSDVERKRQHGLSETESSGSDVGQGIYTDAARSDVYDRLFDCADAVLSSGFNVILDASFLSADKRKLARRLAFQKRAKYVLVDTQAAKRSLEHRLKERSGSDASEADASVLAHQRQSRDPLSALERNTSVGVDTDTGIDIGSIVARVTAVADSMN